MACALHPPTKPPSSKPATKTSFPRIPCSPTTESAPDNYDNYSDTIVLQQLMVEVVNNLPSKDNSDTRHKEEKIWRSEEEERRDDDVTVLQQIVGEVVKGYVNEMKKGGVWMARIEEEVREEEEEEERTRNGWEKGWEKDHGEVMRRSAKEIGRIMRIGYVLSKD